MRIGYLIVLLLYALTIVSAGAIKNQETEVSNYLKILAEANPTEESLLTAPDPFDGSYGSWEKLISKQEQNYPSILTTSIDPNRFNPDLVLEKDLSNGNSKTARDYIAEANYFTKLIDITPTNRQYQSIGHDENITNMNHPIYGNDSTISTANSDLRYIYENYISKNRQKTKDIMGDENENQIYLSYLDSNSVKRQDGIHQAAHLVGTVDNYIPPETQSPENLRRSTLFIEQNRTDSDLYKKLSAFERGNKETEEQALPPDTITEDNNIKIQDSIYSHLFDLNLIDDTSKLPAQSVQFSEKPNQCPRYDRGLRYPDSRLSKNPQQSR